MRFVTPKVFLVGYSGIDMQGLLDYLRYTGNSEFADDIAKARELGISDGEILCSFYAKLCYKSLTVGKNSNITSVRDIDSNLIGTMKSAHFSVFEHAQLNFIATDVSRIYSHEQVRHRAGWAYSQTSGRYCRLDQIDLVWDPILDDCRDIAMDTVKNIELAIYEIECRKGLRVANLSHPDAHPMLWVHKPIEEQDAYKWVPNTALKDFDFKKKVTSAARRLAPNGQANEMGFSVNLRALRHVVQLRTAAGAEREIRAVYEQVYRLTKEKFPKIFYDAVEKEVDGILEVSGMRNQPYDKE